MSWTLDIRVRPVNHAPRAIWIMATSALLVLSLSLAAPGCASAKPRLVLYGDSLGSEAGPFFADVLDPDYRVRISAQPGAAPCDLAALVDDDLSHAPTVAVVEFSGNNTTPCMRDQRGRALRGDALVARYATDVRQLAVDLSAAGAAVILAGAPRSRSDDIATRLNEVYALIALDLAGQGLPVTYVDAAGAALGPDGGFAASLPCRPGDPPDPPCLDGQVTVRAADGVHFTEVGAARYGWAMAAAAPRR